MKNPSPTLSQIAEKAGFSIPVVSRVLSDKPHAQARIAPTTREHILATAKQMGYRPNRNAEFLKRGQNPIIGVFLPRYRNSLIADLVMGLSQAAGAANFPLAFDFDMNAESYSNFIKYRMGQNNCGIITYSRFTTDSKSLKLINDYREQGGKVVTLCAVPPIADITNIMMNDAQGGKLAAEHLIQRGCHRFFFVGKKSRRYDGFAAALSAHKLTVTELDTSDSAIDRLINQCALSDEKTGIFVPGDQLAVKFHSLLLQRQIIPGKRVKLIGYDNLFLSDAITPGLTTIAQPFQQAGILAINTLIKLIYDQKAESSELPVELIIRQTT